MILNDWKTVSKILNQNHKIVVFTGAGISTSAGIPAFTGINGLWTKYDPKFIELDFFYKHPLESWIEIKEIFYKHLLKNAKPTYAHKVIAKMEKDKKVIGVITQNIDNLHQLAGSRNVFEFHGTCSKLICTKCDYEALIDNVDLSSLPPKCPKCNSVLKPNFIFYGEGINNKVYQQSLECIFKADVLLIIGTSGEVSPANSLPFIAKSNNQNLIVIEVNPNTTQYTSQIVDYYFNTKADEFFKNL